MNTTRQSNIRTFVIVASGVCSVLAFAIGAIVIMTRPPAVEPEPAIVGCYTVKLGGYNEARDLYYLVVEDDGGDLVTVYSRDPQLHLWFERAARSADHRLAITHTETRFVGEYVSIVGRKAVDVERCKASSGPES